MLMLLVRSEDAIRRLAAQLLPLTTTWCRGAFVFAKLYYDHHRHHTKKQYALISISALPTSASTSTSWPVARYRRHHHDRPKDASVSIYIEICIEG
ncbi:hypothetical protein Cob_v001447 [Colletotrichum orbiculare MAFF 240422]|uniref:Uncharacterized protein n=1 Tax=Colletotrichum orbiculare (strain 104-T / ATCC 96160 / CBS 514.97 / LARS 414 / MAFF 240422) TaxID=1213857 RepID=A0A484GBB2_COLOR|nr:hypothetical protein Cob_v001447 [Colletotrichum orbiculare MAFF 240422]